MLPVVSTALAMLFCHSNRKAAKTPGLALLQPTLLVSTRSTHHTHRALSPLVSCAQSVTLKSKTPSKLLSPNLLEMKRMTADNIGCTTSDELMESLLVVLGIT